VATGCRVLAGNGHSDYIWGHAALRDPDGRGVWMKSSGIGFEETTPDDVVLVDFDGSVLAGRGRPHREWPIHTEVLRARPDVHAVVHSHPPHAIALGAAEAPLLPVSHAATLFAPGPLPRFDRTANLILTPELGVEVARALGERSALLLVNHGIVVAAADLPTAVVHAILLEDACRQQLLTAALGGARRWSSDEEALAKRETLWPPSNLRAMWAYLVRQLDQPSSSTAANSSPAAAAAASSGSASAANVPRP